MPVYQLRVPTDPEAEAHPMGFGGLVEPVSMLDGVNRRAVVLLGVRSHGERSELVRPFGEALRRKQVEMGADREGTTCPAITDWSRVTARETVEAMLGRKYFPECYVERSGVDDVVEGWSRSSGRALLLLGEAGSGKSSLLARLVDRLTGSAEAEAESVGAGRRDQGEGDEGGGAEPHVAARADEAGQGLPAGREEGAGAGLTPAERPARKRKAKPDVVPGYLAARGQGDVVIFLSGRAAYAGDAGRPGRELLCDAVMQRAGVRPGVFADLADFAARLGDSMGDDLEPGRRVWLVLDALNEADRYADLVTALDAFLPAVERHPWLRLLISLRSGAYHALRRRQVERAGHGGGVFANEGCFLALADEQSNKDVPYLELRPFRVEMEGPRAYAAPERLPERAGDPVERLPPSLRNYCCPRCTCVFHEIWHDRETVPAGLRSRGCSTCVLGCCRRGC